MAEFLHILAEQYDYPQLTDEVLRYLLFIDNYFDPCTADTLSQRFEQQGIQQ